MKLGVDLVLVEQLLLDARDKNRTLWLKSEYGGPALDQWRSMWFFTATVGVTHRNEPERRNRADSGRARRG